MTKRYRFPGLKPFSSDEAAIFFGRDEDIINICTSVVVNPTTLLFGKSGTGKSSLIQAGLLPELHKRKTEKNPEPYRPVTILPKIYDPKSGNTLYEKVIGIINKELNYKENNFLNFSEPAYLSSLWYILKQYQYDQRSSKSDQVLLLIFDQAEELFTHPDNQIDFLVKELHPVLGNFIPDAFQEKIYSQRSTLPRDIIDVLHLSLPVKFIFSIRSDKLHLITRLKKASPHVLQNSYELLPLNKTQAFQAIDGPSQLMDGHFKSKRFQISDDAKEYIFKELSGGLKDIEYNFGETKVEPFSLQIICSYIEQRIVPEHFENGNDDQEVFSVTMELLENRSKPNEIINDYYISCIDNLQVNNQSLSETEKKDVRILIEEKMISENRRIPIHRSTIEQDKDCRVEQIVLERLVDARILSKNYDSYGIPIYEITHDCLIEPILKAKNERIPDPFTLQINNLLNEISDLGKNKSNIFSTEQRDTINSNQENVPQSKVLSIEDDIRLFKTYKKLGETYSSLRDYKNAIENFNKALESLPDRSNISLFTEIFRARSDTYYFWGEYEKSNEDLKRILTQDPGDYTATIYLIENYDKLDQLNNAFDYFQKLKIDRKNAGIYTELGNKYYARKQFDSAIKCYNETIQLYPEADYALRNIGLAEEARGNLESALKFYEQTIALKPGSAEILNDIGNIYYSLKDYDKAHGKYLEAIEVDPNFYFAFHNLGLIEEARKNTQGAIDYYQKAVLANPNYENSFIRMALIFYNNREFDHAREIYQKLIQINPANELNYYDLGLVEEQLQHWDAAIGNFSKTVEINPDDHRAWYSLGKNQHLANKIEQAIISLKKATELNSQHAEYLNELGLCYFDLKNWGKAKDCFIRAANLSPDQYVYHSNIGIAETNLKNIDAAERHFRKAIELKPDDETALARLAGIYFDKENWDRAREIYLKLVEIDPMNELNYYDLGLIEEGLHNWNGAIEYFSKVIEIKPGDDKAWYALGKNQHSFGQTAQAIKSLTKSIELNPQNADSYTELGLCFFDDKKWERAREYFGKALAMSPANYIYQSNMGAVEVELGNLNQAESHLQKSIELQPTFADAYFNYGELLEKLNKPKEAIEQYKKCLQFNSDDTEAIKKIQSLEKTKVK